MLAHNVSPHFAKLRAKLVPAGQGYSGREYVSATSVPVPKPERVCSLACDQGKETPTMGSCAVAPQAPLGVAWPPGMAPNSSTHALVPREFADRTTRAGNTTVPVLPPVQARTVNDWNVTAAGQPAVCAAPQQLQALQQA